MKSLTRECLFEMKSLDFLRIMNYDGEMMEFNMIASARRLYKADESDDDDQLAEFNTSGSARCYYESDESDDDS